MNTHASIKIHYFTYGAISSNIFPLPRGTGDVFELSSALILRIKVAKSKMITNFILVFQFNALFNA